MPDTVSSNIRLFADDALLYRTIHTNEDPLALQTDLDNLQTWERKWQMSFNSDKRKVLTITNKRKIINSNYSIHGTTLETVDEAKYLGVSIQKNLNWKPHVNNICKKANSTRGFLQRNLRKCPSAVKEQAYKTYVRPTLEFASTVWDPHQQELVSQLKMVQRRAARFVKSYFDKKHSVTDMLHDLQWQTRSERRAHSKSIMMYRIVHGLIQTPFNLAHPCFYQTAQLAVSTTSLQDPSVPAYLLSKWYLPVESSPSLSSVSCILGPVPEWAEQPNTPLIQPASFLLTPACTSQAPVYTPFLHGHCLLVVFPHARPPLHRTLYDNTLLESLYFPWKKKKEKFSCAGDFIITLFRTSLKSPNSKPVPCVFEPNLGANYPGRWRKLPNTDLKINCRCNSNNG